MRRAALLGLAALALAACGKVGPVVPPETRLPLPATDLSAEIREGAVVLTWTNPTRRVDGSRMRDLEEARLYRVEDEGVGPPKPALRTRGRIAGYTEIAVIPLPTAETPAPALPPGATVSGPQVRYVDRAGLVPGRRYTYVVLVEDSQGRESSPSERLSVAFVVPPAVPPNLRATPGEGRVRLEWERPATAADGSPLTGPVFYQVLRGAGADAPLAPLGTVGPDETEYTDEQVENGMTYAYAVRALLRTAGASASGEVSARVVATPRDRTPPSVPRDLVAVPAGKEVRLSWRASPEPDVTSYVVYRATGDGPFVRIGTSPATTTVFVDRGVGPGTHRYAVSAVDAATPPNESARSEPAGVTIR